MNVQSREEFEAALTVLKDAKLISLDTETTYITDGEWPELIGLATYCEVKGNESFTVSFYFPIAHDHNPTLFSTTNNLPSEWVPELFTVLERKDVEFIFHNAKFDLQVLRRSGCNITANFWDTMLMATLVDENEPSKALDYLSKKHIEDSKFEAQRLKQLAKDLHGWHRIPPEVMAKYAEQDVRLTWLLFRKFYAEMEQQELLKIWPREMRFSRCLADIESRGIKVNISETKRLAYETQARLQEIQDELGFDPGKPDQLAHALFEEKPEGLGFVPPKARTTRKTDEFPKGVPVMDERTLSAYSHAVIDKVLEYRMLVKANGTWFEGWLSKLYPDGRIHPNFHMHRVVTGRLSASGPNVQQLPKVKEEQRKMVAQMLDVEEGFQLWEFDYSQVEFRLATVYGGDEDVIEQLRQGDDFHSITAQRLGIPRDRDGGKINGKDTNFMMLYGAGPKKIASTLNIPYTEAAELREAWWGSYPGIKAVSTEAERAAQTRGWVRYWDGRKRHFRYPSECHKAFNSICQGGAASIVKKTMVNLHQNYEAPAKYLMISQVHDSVWFKVKECEWTEQYLDEIQEVMEWASKEFPVPFPVDRKQLINA